KYFQFEELGTNYRTEFMAGMTTFLVMAYIFFVNLSVLLLEGIEQLTEGGTSIDQGVAVKASTIAAIVGCVFIGLTSCLTISFVNPSVLAMEVIEQLPEGVTRMDQGAVFTATAIAAAVGSLLMGLLARYPIGLAPGMGLNAFFAYTVVLGYGIPWETALAGVF